MKGIMIYETPLWGNEENAVYLQEVKDASYTLKQVGNDAITCYLEGIVTEDPVTKAKCNKEDTYDFETGALIALMKMCGFDKSYKAIEEAFKYNSYDTKKTKELERAYKASNDDKAKLVEYYQREIKKLEAENEKLQHGYVVGTTMIFCGGRQNSKQYKALVELFKKLDQKKVDAAYKEAYNTTLPVWQKEVLKQMYEIRKIEASKYSLPHVHEWYYRIPTKREEMWEKIFVLHKENDVIIEVKKEDVTTFLHEIETKFPEITWASGTKIFETKYTIKDVYFELKTCDIIYFRLSRETKLTYSDDPHIYQYRELKHIDYLPPMRWDLFKKGRIAVRLTKDNYKEFYDICEKELGRSPSYKPDEFAYAPMEKYILKYNKKFKGYTFLGSTESDKIVNWEDAR